MGMGDLTMGRHRERSTSALRRIHGGGLRRPWSESYAAGMREEGDGANRGGPSALQARRPRLGWSVAVGDLRHR
ncbi:hypothetical protein F4558_001479 [Micromonospora profundi]|nr:hypothetical protein [Micromonospora profundi]